MPQLKSPNILSKKTGASIGLFYFQELRPDEIERKLRRKDQNRRAATRFRNKRKEQTVNMQEVSTGIVLNVLHINRRPYI